MIGRHRVAEQREHARIANVGDRARLHRHADEVRRILHVGRLVVPRVDLAARQADRIPVLIAGEHARVALAEHRGVDRLGDELLNLGRRRPDVLEVNRLAIAAGAQRLGRQIEIQRAGERIGNDERRRGEEVHLHFRMHAAFEVAIAGQHRARDHIACLHGIGDLRLQRTGVADAGRAAVADRIEADRFEISGEAGLRQVVGHDARARREAGLHPRLRRQAALARVACEQACGDQHGGIRCIRAARDRGDQHRAVFHFE